ncbi:hypothetical protein KP79_PYT22295 [Mizuhopecten yessoensis]|uniref:Uncharacterized protein n=1 Tax=Mizuhopecten yessoensis TaxID=6573 RepID=A0A210PY23_MIZYE|nr:hypothetical protein KP79_PYT22295 [Mizuhopecten yessoensis]
MSLFKKSTRARRQVDNTRLRNLNKSRTLRSADSYPSRNNSYGDIQGLHPNDDQGSKSLVSSSDDENDEENGTFPANSNQQKGQIGMFHFSMASGRDINNIALTNNRAWISYWNNNEVAQVNRHGEIRKVVSLDIIITDISYSSATRELWMCCRDYTVRERESPESARVAFKTKRLPLSLCMLSDGTALVGMEFNITKYDLNGRVLQALDRRDLGGNPLVYPERIRQCPHTRRVGIVDRSFAAWGGNGKPSVSVLNENLEFQFGYLSLDHTSQFSSYQHEDTRISKKVATASAGNAGGRDCGSPDTAQSLEDRYTEENNTTTGDYVNISSPTTTFNPRDMCFGPRGQAIIADYQNKIVLSINSSGEYQHQLLTSDVRPCALDCDSNGKLWVGFKRQVVKLVQLQL